MPDHPFDQDSAAVEKPADPIAAMRLQLCHLLPRAMQNAISSYQDFSEQTAPDDAKSFIAHHNACRAALAHLDALSKLGRWLASQHPQTPETDHLQPLLLQARRVLTELDGTFDEPTDEPGAAEF